MREHLQSILGPGGQLAQRLAGEFESRPEQMHMALAVARAFEEKSHLLAEAGTGVGKSFAYLIPAMLRCLLSNEVVVIATNTIALQEQLVKKDVPLLASIVEDTLAAALRSKPLDGVPSGGVPLDEQFGDQSPALPKIRPVLVKGRGNYMSIRRLKLASTRQDKLFPDAAARRSLHQIEDWAMSTLDGTISTLPALERMGVWDKVQSDSGNCMGRKCAHYNECFYQSARREMEQGNLLICNHALYFSDLALRSQEFGFLPTYHHVVLDEAHGIEDVASEHFGLSLSEGRVQHLLSTLYHQRTGKGYLPQLSLLTGDTGKVDGTIKLAIEAAEASRVFFQDLADFVRREAAGDATGANPPTQFSAFGTPMGRAGPFASSNQPATCRIRTPDVIANPLGRAMHDLSLRLKSLKEDIKGEADRFELNAYAERAQLIADASDALIEQSRTGCAYWAEITGGGPDDQYASPRVTLACAPIEVAPLLKERLFSQPFSVVLTSATLATRTVASKAPHRAPLTSAGDAQAPTIVIEPAPELEPAQTDFTPDDPDRLPPGTAAFAYSMQRLGCDGARTLQLGSPFDHERQVRFIIDRTPPRADEDADDSDSLYNAPRPRGRYPARRPDPAQSPAHLADRIEHHVLETDGGAFVLFTSFATLKSVARLLRPRLERRDLPLLAQNVDGSRTAILDQFRLNDRSVLFGAASFWQGVDVRGKGLRNVIITKLPFEPPDRPLTQARLERIQATGGDPFRDDSLPRAVIRFKQGFGRLIRSKSDHGRVVCLDPRLIASSYGRAFLDALPAGLKPIILGAYEQD